MQRMSIYTHINPTKFHTEYIPIEPISQKAPQLLSELSPPLYMAKSSSVSLIFILVVLFCSTPVLEARKILSLKKAEVSSLMEESLDFASSSNDIEGHYPSVNNNGRLSTLHLPSIDHRMLPESVPSPGIGHIH